MAVAAWASAGGRLPATWASAVSGFEVTGSGAEVTPSTLLSAAVTAAMLAALAGSVTLPSDTV